MGFWLKKVIGQALMPTPVFMILFFIGLMLLQFSKKKRLAMSCLWTSFSLLFLSFWPVTGASFVGAIENGYDHSILDDQHNISYISILGHGHIHGEKLSATSKLSDAAIKRLVEGIRLGQIYPKAKLILTGWKGYSDLSHEILMRDAAISLGFPSDRIICFSDCRDTAEEAQRIKEIADQQVVVIVSEASHLRRASYLYEQQGLQVLTSAADRKSVILDGSEWIFNSRSLQRVERAWYEFLGNIWVRLRS